MEANINIQNLRVLSQIFSPSIFQKIVREEDSSIYDKKIVKFLNCGLYNNNLELIKFLYKSLQKQYRCEYIYKNSIFIDIIKSYGLKNTLTFNEFKIGYSKADLVLLNGSIRIYEIKTELDDLSKLSKQLLDYQKFADKVFIVTDAKNLKKLTSEYTNSNIGIIFLTSNNRLETIKEANRNCLSFDFDTIFKTLRKNEYLEIVQGHFGNIPNVPNTKIFRVCYELLSQLDIVYFQKQVLEKLKERKISEPKLLKSTKTPQELKHICNILDFNKQEYQKLYTFLSQNTHVPTIYQRETI